MRIRRGQTVSPGHSDISFRSHNVRRDAQIERNAWMAGAGAYQRLQVVDTAQQTADQVTDASLLDLVRPVKKLWYYLQKLLNPID